jgi:hypothetical protein
MLELWELEQMRQIGEDFTLSPLPSLWKELWLFGLLLPSLVAFEVPLQLELHKQLLFRLSVPD